METLGDKLKKLRLKYSLSQKALSDELCINQYLISNYERNLRIPNESTLKKYCNFFEVDREYFDIITPNEIKHSYLCVSVIFNSIAPDYSQEERKEAVKEAVDIYKLIFKEIEK